MKTRQYFQAQLDQVKFLLGAWPKKLREMDNHSGAPHSPATSGGNCLSWRICLVGAREIGPSTAQPWPAGTDVLRQDGRKSISGLPHFAFFIYVFVRHNSRKSIFDIMIILGITEL